MRAARGTNETETEGDVTRPLTGAPLGGACRVKQRGDTAKGIAAVLLLLVVAVGVPVALIYAFGNPIPVLPDGDIFSAVVTSSFVLDVIVCIVWLAWAQFTACLLAELVAGTRGTGIPRRVPLSGAQQDLARRLVMAVLLLSTASHGLHSAASPGGGQAEPTVSATAQSFDGGQRTGDPFANLDTTQVQRAGALDGQQSTQRDDGAQQLRTGAEQASTTTPAKQQRGAPVTKEYMVMPPQGSHHDSLWDIADRYLGSGVRYHEIFELNEGRVQPDGGRLTLESLIRPGWVLVLPADAHGPGLIEVTDGGAGNKTLPAPPTRAQTGGAAATHTQPAGHQQGGAEQGGNQQQGGQQGGEQQAGGQQSGGQQAGGQQGGGQQQDGPITGSGTLNTSGTDATVTPVADGQSEQGGQQTDGPTAVEAAPAERTADIPWDIVGAELLAAGLLEALIMLRRRRMRTRVSGAATVRPGADAAAAEVGIRLGADPDSAAFVDHALRAMARGLAETDRPMPEVFGARLRADRLELLLAVPLMSAPPPFAVEQDGAVWSLRRDASLPPVDGVSAPLPGLVSIGGDGESRVFIDLEAAGGAISIDGDLNAARSVVAAAAVELVTNRWSDDMRVTLVGFGNALAPIRPDRLRCVSSLSEVLDEVTDRLSVAQQELSGQGLDSVLTGRVRGGGAYAPEFVVLAAPPDPEELAALQAWSQASRRAPLGVLVAGACEQARWQCEIGDDGVLSTGVLGLTVGAQQLSARSYAALARLVQQEAQEAPRATADEAGTAPEVEQEATSPTGPRLPRAVDRHADVLVRIFGEPMVEGPDLPPGTPLSVEIATYVALAGEVSPRALAADVWPYGVTRAERDAAIERAASWLGDADDGKPRLRLTDGGRLRLTDDVQLDWHLFVALTQGGDEQDALAALELAQAPLVQPRPARRYAWLARNEVAVELPAYVVDVAHRLAAGYLDSGEHDGAVAVTRAGLRVEPDASALWDQLQAAVAGRDGPGAALSVQAERHARMGTSVNLLAS